MREIVQRKILMHITQQISGDQDSFRGIMV